MKENLRIFGFTKEGVEFQFRNPHFNGNSLIMQYKIVGIKENNTNDGYYFNAEFIPERGINFSDVKIKGRRVSGVRPPDNIMTELKTLLDAKKEEYNKAFNEIVEELVSGIKNIEFSIVGCDFPHYQPWISVPENLKRWEQDIMSKAISKVLGQTIYSNPCEYLESILNRYIFTKDDMPDNIINPRHEQKTLEYYGYKDTVVTHFEMKLMSLMKPVLDKIQEENKKVQEALRKAKETGEKQLLVQWSEECNDPEESCNIDNCYKYAMPDGSIKIERYHTW